MATPSSNSEVILWTCYCGSRGVRTNPNLFPETKTSPTCGTAPVVLFRTDGKETWENITPKPGHKRRHIVNMKLMKLMKLIKHSNSFEWTIVSSVNVFYGSFALCHFVSVSSTNLSLPVPPQPQQITHKPKCTKDIEGQPVGIFCAKIGKQASAPARLANLRHFLK